MSGDFAYAHELLWHDADANCCHVRLQLLDVNAQTGTSGLERRDVGIRLERVGAGSWAAAVSPLAMEVIVDLHNAYRREPVPVRKSTCPIDAMLFDTLPRI